MVHYVGLAIMIMYDDRRGRSFRGGSDRHRARALVMFGARASYHFFFFAPTLIDRTPQSSHTHTQTPGSISWVGSTMRSGQGRQKWCSMHADRQKAFWWRACMHARTPLPRRHLSDREAHVHMNSDGRGALVTSDETPTAGKTLQAKKVVRRDETTRWPGCRGQAGAS